MDDHDDPQRPIDDHDRPQSELRKMAQGFDIATYLVPLDWTATEHLDYQNLTEALVKVSTSRYLQSDYLLHYIGIAMAIVGHISPIHPSLKAKFDEPVLVQQAGESRRTQATKIFGSISERVDEAESEREYGLICVELDGWISSFIARQIVSENPKAPQNLVTKSLHRQVGRVNSVHNPISKKDLLTEGLRNEVRVRKQLEIELEATKEARISAEKASSSAQRAANISADSTLNSLFSTHAVKEGKKATALAALAIVATVGVAILAAIILKDAHELPLAVVVARIGLSIPILVTAGFIASLSSKFRKSAEWAKLAAVQTSTIDGFLESLPDDQKGELRMLLGRKLYGQADFSKADSNSSEREMNFTEVSELLKQIAKRGNEEP